MTKYFGQLAVVLALSSVASPAHSASVTIGASKDNSMFQNNPDRSAGGAAGIFVGTTAISAGVSPRRGLIAFDVAASVPPGATITGAQLTLHLGAAGGGADQTIHLHRLLADWGEGTAGSSNPTIAHAGRGYTASPGDATWNERFHGSAPWSNPGAEGDYEPTASASTVVSDDVEAPFTWSSAALVSDVQSWLDDPANNFGWLLMNGDEISLATARAFYSRTAAANAGGDPMDPIARPALRIDYLVAIPEPAAAVLLLASGPWLFLGRCRAAAS